MQNGTSMYRLIENGKLQLLTKEVFDFSGGELTQSNIKELKNSLYRYTLIGG